MSADQEDIRFLFGDGAAGLIARREQAQRDI